MKFPPHRQPQQGPFIPKANRPLRGGPIPVSEADLPFFAALTGRQPTADDRTAVFVSGFELSDDGEARPAWPRRVVARVKQMLSLKRAG